MTATNTQESSLTTADSPKVKQAHARLIASTSLNCQSQSRRTRSSLNSSRRNSEVARFNLRSSSWTTTGKCSDSSQEAMSTNTSGTTSYRTTPCRSTRSTSQTTAETVSPFTSEDRNCQRPSLSTNQAKALLETGTSPATRFSQINLLLLMEEHLRSEVSTVSPKNITKRSMEEALQSAMLSSPNLFLQLNAKSHPTMALATKSTLLDTSTT
jgi:hypothetical protein